MRWRSLLVRDARAVHVQTLGLYLFLLMEDGAASSEKDRVVSTLLRATCSLFFVARKGQLVCAACVE